ncbi:MAG: class I SAM-dependent methyltransferase [Actinomycetes bacterium]
MTTAAEHWRLALADWAIPPEILSMAPESPWIHPVEMFTVSGDIPDSPSHQRAREALPEGGSVLDVGCGGGRASMAVAPPAGLVIGVDHQPAMLDKFEHAARERGVASQTVPGDWPEAAPRSPVADVVVCHHVAYNVPDLTPFLLALDEHARNRVVLELPTLHPLTHMSPFWDEFWGLTRPTSPTADDCLAVAREAGFDAHIQIWEDQELSMRAQLPVEQQARFLRIRLCLPEDREPELVAAVLAAGEPPIRYTATLWWDKAK